MERLQDGQSGIALRAAATVILALCFLGLFAASPSRADANISAGAYHSCAVVKSAAKCWGFNIAGQLGTGTTISSPTPISVQGLTSGVTAISAGEYHTCAIVNGAAKCWGANNYGQLGNGTTSYSHTPVDVQGLTSGATAIAAGPGITCAIVNGAAKCWGANSEGQLGNGTATNSSTPVDVQGLTSGVTAIALGTYHACAVVNNAAKCWGYNYYGQLGNGTATSSSTPVDVQGLTSGVTAVAARANNSCIVANGGAKCWGYNGEGQLGNGTATNSSIPVDVQGLTSGVTAITTGDYHSCAVGNGGFRCWGYNFRGQLGNNSTADSLIPVDVQGIAPSASSISAGTNHSCAVDSGAVKCWGFNFYGQLGNNASGGSADSLIPVDAQGLSSGVSAISVGGYHSCAVVNGAAKCWGYNGNGQLGNGTLTNAPTPGTVQGLTSGVTAIWAGAFHTCAIVNAGAKCWGSNPTGQLGNGTTTFSTIPVDVQGLAVGVTAISAGTNHSCAVVNGAAKCWGSSLFGQLGDGSSTNSSIPIDVQGLTAGVIAITAGAQHSCAIVNAAAKCWGYNASGQLGNGTTTNSSSPVNVQGLAAGVTAISAGAYHACAIVNAAAKCWGSNGDGRLGNGTTTDSSTPVSVQGLASGVTAISAGEPHTCAIANGGAKCWGYNFRGQLGDGTTATSTTPVAVRLDNTPPVVSITPTTSPTNSNASQDIAFTATDASGIDSYTCALNAATATTCTSPFSTGTLAEGTNTITITATDIGGNAGTATASITLDTELPVVTITPPISPTNSPADQSIVFSASDNLAVASVQCQIDAGTFTACSLPIDLAPGESLTVRATDTAGNQGTASTSIVLDITPPVLSITPPTPSLTSQDISFTATDNLSVATIECKVDEASFAICASPFNLAPGQTLSVKAADHAGNSTVESVSIGSTAISAGDVHSCAVINGAAKCWGYNGYGGLGNATTTDSNIPVDVQGLTSGVTAISTGNVHSCAVINDAAKCWGYNGSGQLGDAAATDSNIPVDVQGLASDVTAISAGNAHSCAIVDGAAKCWGYNVYGGLGNGSNTNSSIPVDVQGLTSGVTAISAGTFHSCAIVDGAAKCWGYNGNGRLGNATTTDSNIPVDVQGLTAGVTAISAGTYHSCAIVNGAAKCWGDNGNGQLGDATTTTTDIPVDVQGLTSGVTAISAGNAHSCAIVNGAAKCWGDNGNGQLGDATTTTTNIPVDVQGLTAGVTAISAGDAHSCAIINGTAKCWGYNGNGQFGNATNADASTPVSVRSESVSPTLVLSPAPDPITNSDASQEFTFTATDDSGIASVTCQVGVATPATCTSPFSTGTLTEGTNTITVVATDNAGNAATATTSITLDTELPVVSITPPISPTNSPADQSIVFSASDNLAVATLECKIDAGAFATCTSPVDLAPGEILSVRATDTAGNVKTESVSIVADTTAPTLTVDAAPDAITNLAASQDITFAASDASGIDEYTCAVGAATPATCTSPFATGTLTEGTNTITVVATDNAGNAATATATITLDTELPVVSITPPTSPTNSPADQSIVFSATDNLTVATLECKIDAGAFAACTSPIDLAPGETLTVRATDTAGNEGTATASIVSDTTAPTLTVDAAPDPITNLAASQEITFSATDASGIASVTCALGAATPATCTSPFSTGTLTEGLNTVTVVATDNAGNAATAAASITLDTELPVVSITPPISPTNSPADQSIVFSASDNLAVATLECKIDAGAFATCASPVDLAPGETLTVRATDTAGNEGTATTAIVSDTTAPTLTVDAAPDAITNSDASQDITFAASDTSGIDEYTCAVGAATAATCTSPFSTGTLAEGDNTITVVATDNAGNAATATATITLDTELPVVSITPPISPTNSPADQSIVFAATDNLAIATLECKIDAGAFAICTSPVDLAPGETLSVRATDTAGNVKTETASIVADTTAPTLTVDAAPDPITNLATSQDITFAATDASGIASVVCDLNGGTPTTTCTSPFATGTLAEGSNTITVVATDNAGNAATATATITLDTELPVVTIAPPTSPTNAPADQSITFTATDNLMVASTECQIDAGAFATCTSPVDLAPGETLTVRATDTAGNQGTATASIVSDTTAPVLTITPPSSPTNSALSQGIAFTATDISGIDNVVCSINGGAPIDPCSSPVATGTLNQGVNTISITATDNAGNDTTESVSIELDDILPTIAIEAPAVPLGSLASIDISFTITDASSIASTTCSLNGSTAATCTSPFSTGTLLEGTNTLTVTAVDSLGNIAASTASFLANRPPDASANSPVAGIVRSNNPRLIAGIAGPTGKVVKVEVALRRVDGKLRRRQGKCMWFTGRATALRPRRYKQRTRGCRTIRWVKAIGTERWSVTLAKRLPAGSYRRYVRVTLTNGTVTKRFTKTDGTFEMFRAR